MTEKKATKEQIDHAVSEITKQFSTLNSDNLIGFLLGAKDDDMFLPENDEWLKWTKSELIDACVESYLKMAVEKLSGKVFKSELRGSSPYGVA